MKWQREGNMNEKGGGGAESEFCVPIFFLNFLKKRESFFFFFKDVPTHFSPSFDEGGGETEKRNKLRLKRGKSNNEKQRKSG